MRASAGNVLSLAARPPFDQRNTATAAAAADGTATPPTRVRRSVCRPWRRDSPGEITHRGGAACSSAAARAGNADGFSAGTFLPPPVSCFRYSGIVIIKNARRTRLTTRPASRCCYCCRCCGGSDVRAERFSFDLLDFIQAVGKMSMPLNTIWTYNVFYNSNLISVSDRLESSRIHCSNNGLSKLLSYFRTVYFKLE